MTLVIESIPFRSSELPAWLERQLVGDRLAELVGELLAVRPKTTPLDFAAWFAPIRDGILSGGLSGVPLPAIRKLLAHPPSLRHLQKEVLRHGGPYWDRVPRPEDCTKRLAAARPVPSAEPVTLTVAPARVRRRLPEWVVGLATAAVVLLAVYGVSQFLKPPPAPQVAAWGWNRGLPPETTPPREYLTALADRVDEWRNERPNTADEVLRRLVEFRTSCGVVLAADHPSLPPDLRKTLCQRCGKWSGAADELIEKLKSGADPQAVLGEADALIAKLSSALRNGLPAA
jgi:hypothetical protein